MAMRVVNLGWIAHHLSDLEKYNFILAHVKGDIAFGVVVHGARKIRSHNAMSISIVLLVKFFFYIPCNILKKKSNVSTFGSSQPTNQPNNQPTNQPST